jgi:hypothetical protein
MLLPTLELNVTFAELVAKALTGKELKTFSYFILGSVAKRPFYLVVIPG